MFFFHFIGMSIKMHIEVYIIIRFKNIKNLVNCGYIEKYKQHTISFISSNLLILHIQILLII